MTLKYIRDISLIFLLYLSFNTISIAQTPAVDSTKVVSENINIAYGTQPSWITTSSISSISGDDLLKSFKLSLGNRLPGLLPGLTVMATGNEPGVDNPTFSIRGLNTYGSGRSVLVLVDGIESAYENLVPEEIESLSVLKDASALAIFGSRGANGVLMVTTKKGTAGSLKINFSTQQGFSQASRLPEFLGSYDYATLYNEARNNDGLEPIYSDEDLAAYRAGTDKYFHPDVNWYNEILRKTAPISNYDINFSGGNSNVKYFVLLNYASDNGLYKRTANRSIHSIDQDYSRFNLRSNIDINVTRDFNFKLLLGAQNQKKSNPKANETASMFDLLSSIPPNAFPVYNPNGTFGANSLYSNPVGDALMTGFYTSNTRTIQMKSIATQKLDMITKGLNISAVASFNNYFSSRSNKSRDYARYEIAQDQLGEISYNQFGQETSLSASENASDHSSNTEWQVALNYKNSFGANDIDAMLMYTELTNNIAGVATPYRNNGVRGRATYALYKKYIGELAFAYNGTENFPKGSRWGLFPAVSIGWIITQEDFLKDGTYLNYLKIRGSYGMVGNDDIGGLRFMFNPQAYVQDGNYYYGSTNSSLMAVAEGQIRNGNVTWEKEKKLNFGFDATLFHNLDVTFDIFKNDRYDILAKPNRTVPAFFGMASNLPDFNLGKTNNRGFETKVTYYSEKNKVFEYYLSASMWYAKNKIVYRAEEIRQFDYLYRTGQRIDQPYRLEALGFFKDQSDIDNSPRQIYSQVQPGDIKYKDQNGDNIIDQNDIVSNGFTSFPEISGAFEAGLKFKNFDLNVLLQGVTNRSVYLSGNYYQAFQNDGKISTVALGRWTSETAGTATYPRLSSSNNINNSQGSSFWSHDGSYIKLRNLGLGYNLPEKIVSKVKFDSARFFINGTNLFSWDHLDYSDPETLSGYPAMKTYSIGARFQF